MKIYAGLLLLFLISCSTNPEKSKTISDSIKKDSVQKITVKTPDSVSQNDSLQWPIGLPVDIIALKKKYGVKGLLSSVVPKSKMNLTCRNDSVKGFLGEYYFLDSISMKNFELRNTLTVFKPGKPDKWRMEATDEKFVSIELKNPMIKLWDSLHVGMPVINFPQRLIACKTTKKNSGEFTGISYKDENGIITEIYVELLCGPPAMLKAFSE